jgi:hypothetical protein
MSMPYAPYCTKLYVMHNLRGMAQASYNASNKSIKQIQIVHTARDPWELYGMKWQLDQLGCEYQCIMAESPEIGWISSA